MRQQHKCHKQVGHKGPGETPAKAGTQSRCPARIQLTPNCVPGHSQALNLKMRVSPTRSAVKAGRDSLSGVDPSVGENAETAPKAVKSLQGPQLEAF